MTSHWKTSLAGTVATVAGCLALLSQALPPKYAAYCLIAGQVANGIGNVLSQDAPPKTP